MTIDRVFLDWHQPALPAAANYLIDHYVDGDVLDLSRGLLVFSGRRAARRMLEILVQKTADRWPGMIPPSMVTFHEFPEQLYPQKRTLADDLTQLLVWKQALSSIPAKELQAALPTIPDDEAVPAWLALCETLRRQHNELAADGLEFDEIFAALSKVGNKSEAARWKALRRIQSEYLMRMDELGLWDRQIARLIAVQQSECRADRDILLIGTVDMNRIVQQMLDQVADRVTALIHAPPEEADQFDNYGCLKADQWLTRRLNLPMEIHRIVDRPADQAQEVVRELAAVNGQYRADEITIGVADDTLVPAVMQALSDSGVAGRWPVGMKIRSTRACRLLHAILQYLASARAGLPADFSTFSDLIRHPDLQLWIQADLDRSLKGRSGTVDWLTEFDLYLAEHLQTVPGEFLGPSPRREIVESISHSVDRLLEFLLPVSLRPADNAIPPLSSARKKSSRQTNAPKSTKSTGRQRQMLLDESGDRSRNVQSLLTRSIPVQTWAEGCLRLLSAVYNEREFHDTQAADRGIVACVRGLQDLVDSLRRVPLSVLPRCAATQGIQMLLQQIADESVAPAADETAIDLLGWLELPLDDSELLILTGFNEGFVPESASSDVFLPNSFRKQLGLTDNDRRYARDAYALTVLMHSRKHLRLIAGRQDPRGNPLAPSRLWFAAEPKSLPWRVKQFYAPEQLADQESAAAVVPAQVQTTAPGAAAATRVSGFILPPPAVQSTPPTRLSVTAFREYIACPYRYVIRRELRLSSIDDEVRELTAPAFGSLIHDVLSHFGKSAVREALKSELIESFLLNELRRQSLRRFGRDRSATVSVQLQMIEDRLRSFARWQAGVAAEGWRITHTEVDLEYPEFLDIQDRPVALIGRVDRIDQHRSTGEWRVLDYKTSESADKPELTHQKKGEWVDLQLPLYRLLVRSLGIDGDLQLGYIHLPGDLSKIGCSIAKWEHADLESAEIKAREVAADILDLKIDRVAPGDPQRPNELSRICQDTVIDRQMPWLTGFKGR